MAGTPLCGGGPRSGRRSPHQLIDSNQIRRPWLEEGGDERFDDLEARFEVRTVDPTSL
jgi:hypothetical protein